MEILPITNEQYDTVIIRFTDYLVNLMKIKTEKGYLNELRRLKRAIGYASPQRSLLGGMRVMRAAKQKTRIRKRAITMRRVMQDRIDRQSRRLTFNVMGRRLNAETIGAVIALAFFACAASVFGGLLSPLYPTVLYVVFSFYYYDVVVPEHYDNAMRDVAWIELFLREMDRIDALPPPVQLHQFTPANQQYMVRPRSQMNISPLALGRPSLFPTYVRYTEIMQSMLRASMTRPDGGGSQRLCILGMAGMAGIAARKFLQPRLVELGVAQSVGDRVRRGTVRNFLRAIDSEKAFDRDSRIIIDHMKSKRKLHFYHSGDAADGNDDNDASALP